MFENLTLRGADGRIVWGYHTAVTLRAWAIRRDKATGHWHLVATVARVDPFQARQKPLLFSAPRAGGFWCWGIESIDIVGLSLRARLGPPER